MSYKRIHVFYSGYIQGVGFRYTVRNLAPTLGIKGWVKNLRDGKVEVIAEGNEEKLNIFLDDIKNEFPVRFIKDVDINWEEATREFKSFNIAF